MHNCKICKNPCVGEYLRNMNAGRSAYCYIEVLEQKRKQKRNKMEVLLKNMEVFISEEKIHDTVIELANRINKDYNYIHLVGLLKGSFIFMADLIRYLTIPATIDFMSVTSYEGTESSGEVKVLKELNDSIFNKDVIIIEDIVDTGTTLRGMLDLLLTKHPKSLEVCTLLDKPSRRIKPVRVKYCGIEIEDKFVVGYGIDYNQNFRQLPYIGVIEN